ncbi:MAG: CDP-alcohol phosphatidyltransferase family protein [Deltaproteobacteria bacterium]|nr:CDP-alcohol phosphatidyltransferase family protein [Deltaproteobacteria bacterium]
MEAALDLDAIILADDPLASVSIAGLTARERASRVAGKVGASRVLVIDGSRDGVTAWRNGRTCPLLVIRADQLVHTPLAAPLIEAIPDDGTAIAVGPDGSYAGAYVAAGSAAGQAITAIARGDNTTAFADATKIPHGEIARHPIATREDREGAHQLLYRLLIKPQDNVIARYMFRPIARRLTRLLVQTPITPNMLSVCVAVMITIACVLTATADPRLVIIGAALQASSNYIDCCDGEIARLKLMTSRFGAWLDTVVDELSTVAYMVACGWHCHLYWGHPGWDIWTVGIVVGLGTYLLAMSGIYYNIIVAVGSANSQDYVGKFEVVPGDEPNTVRLKPVVTEPVVRARPRPPWLQKIVDFAPNVVRRDFIVWCALIFAIFHLLHVSFAVQLTGGIVSAIIVSKDHIQLRLLRRKIARSGQRLLPPRR